MSVIALILLVALLIPIMGIVVDSPIGRALARRLEGPQDVPPGLAELAKKVDLLEAEVDDLTRSVQTLQDENAFLQRLLGLASALPPPTAVRSLTRPPRGHAASGGDGGRRHPAEPDRGPGPEPGLRPLLRHLRRGGRVQRRVPDPQLPAEPVRRRRALGLVHSGVRRAASTRPGGGGADGRGRRGGAARAGRLGAGAGRRAAHALADRSHRARVRGREARARPSDWSAFSFPAPGFWSSPPGASAY